MFWYYNQHENLLKMTGNNHKHLVYFIIISFHFYFKYFKILPHFLIKPLQSYKTKEQNSFWMPTDRNSLRN